MRSSRGSALPARPPLGRAGATCAPTAGARGRSTGPLRGSRSTPDRAARRRARRPRSWRSKQDKERPCGHSRSLRRGRHGRTRSPLTTRGVHRPERRGGQGDEELGVLEHRRVDALAASDAGRHELPGVGLVEAGARRADRGPPVLAGTTRSPLDAARRCERSSVSPRRRIGLRAQPGLVDLGQDRAPVGGRAHHGRLRRAAAMSARSAMASSSR